MGEVAVSDGEVTHDAFLGGGLSLRQPAKGYRAGVDAVLLAASAPVATRDGGAYLDLGAGVGTVGLCVARRLPQARVVLVEREPQFVALARDNIAANGLSERVRVAALDITAARAAELAEAGIGTGRFAHVLANPPFHTHGSGTASGQALKAGAHAMAEGGLELWVRFMARVAAPGGTGAVIHKAEALGQVLAAFDRRFGAIRVLPILARAGQPAIRILVRGVKGSGAPLVLLAPLVLHAEDGAFLPQVSDMLRHGAPLPLEPD